MQHFPTAYKLQTVRQAAIDAHAISSIGYLNPGRDESISEVPSSHGFGALLAAYRATGGTARSDDVARVLEDHRPGDCDGLEQLIASDDVFGFEWRGTRWIPMFQFNPEDLSIKPASRLVLAELGTGFDGWARAAWFAQSNPWLNYRSPVDMVSTDLPEVLAAARTDRFIAVG